jgi:poly(beta-D-mannuronate) lyase
VRVLWGFLLIPILAWGSGATLVRGPAEYEAAARSARPGDTIMLADGVWRDFEIVFAGNGDPKRPITLTAQTPGMVILSGKSNLRIAGSHLVV